MTQSKTLADRLLPGEGVASDAARIVAANLLLVLCARVAVPLPWTPVPLTGQSFGLLFAAVLLGSRRAALAVLLYLLEGAAGLPVFQPFGAPGVARFAGPTAGYLLAAPAVAFVTGWLVELGETTRTARGAILRLLGALVAGEVVLFAGACAWLATVYGMGWSRAQAVGLAPFIAGEVIKIAGVVGAVRGAELAMTRGRAD